MKEDFAMLNKASSRIDSNGTYANLPPYSVLMSVYEKDEADWFEIAIESMANQSWPPFEIVIIEDGPISPILQEVEQRCMQRHPTLIHCIACPQRRGLAEAMRHGIQFCTCEWIARMDADDISDLRRCEEELKAAIEKNADIVGCDCEEFIENVDYPLARRLFPEKHNDLLRFSRRRTPFCHPAVIMKKNAVLQAGNYQDIYLLEDYDLFVRMFSCNAVGYTVKKVLYHVRVGTDFYARRVGRKYLKSLLSFNLRLLKSGWMTTTDFLIRSSGNIVVSLAPVPLRELCYRRLLRK